MIIAFEGIDGCGKTTLIKMFAEYVKLQGSNVIISKGLGGTDIGEKIRSLLLDNSNKPTDMCELLLIYAQRAQHQQEVIKSNPDSVILMDRYTDSTYAYQAAARGIDPKILNTLDHMIDLNYAHITYYLKISSATSVKRMADRSLDRFEKEKQEFFDKVIKGYEENLVDSVDIWIDAEKPIKEVFKDIVDHYNRYSNIAEPLYTLQYHRAGLCDHDYYYAQFVNNLINNLIVRRIGVERIIKCEDDNFNNISLKEWDMLHNDIINLLDSKKFKLLACADYKTAQSPDPFVISLCDTVCIAKAAAFVIKQNASAK